MAAVCGHKAPDNLYHLFIILTGNHTQFRKITDECLFIKRNWVANIDQFMRSFMASAFTVKQKFLTELFTRA